MCREDETNPHIMMYIPEDQEVLPQHVLKNQSFIMTLNDGLFLYSEPLNLQALIMQGRFLHNAFEQSSCVITHTSINTSGSVWSLSSVTSVFTDVSPLFTAFVHYIWCLFGHSCRFTNTSQFLYKHKIKLFISFTIHLIHVGHVVTLGTCH